ncbi:MAG: NUDIX domain-containing protein [Clostridiales bacterium]|jgi:mutator protein MutT|nr:NUDIX domain-containing protein [Clostridiales bacterium]
MKLKALSAIFPVILRNDEGSVKILLHRRQNTGYQDGKWDISGSGHVDEGETATEAVVRECKEELGITVNPDNLEFIHLSQRFLTDRTYYDIYFIVKAYGGEPAIMEPDKCSDLKWFNIDSLPHDIIECRREDILHYLNGIPYSEKTKK